MPRAGSWREAWLGILAGSQGPGCTILLYLGLALGAEPLPTFLLLPHLFLKSVRMPHLLHKALWAPEQCMWKNDLKSTDCYVMAKIFFFFFKNGSIDDNGRGRGGRRKAILGYVSSVGRPWSVQNQFWVVSSLIVVNKATVQDSWGVVQGGESGGEVYFSWEFR